MFKNSFWIWNSIDFTDDEYVDFYQCFNLQKTSGVKLHISVDGMFCVYLNGKIVGFGECSDDENNKLYDTFSLDKATVCGDNELLITVWHHGSSCAIYKPAKAGCIFTLEQIKTSLTQLVPPKKVALVEKNLSAIELGFNY